MDRNNEMWLTHLSSDGAERESALSDLRKALLRGLRASLWQGALADDSLLEDVVQEALLRIIAGLQQFEGRSRFLTWATAIAVHTAMNELRHRRWKDVSLEAVMTDLAPEFAAEETSRPDVRWERKTTFERLAERVYDMIYDDLTERQRAALLAELKGMPQSEIARHLGSSRNAVYKLTHEARKRLKRGLEAAGYQAEDIRAAFEF